MEKGELKRAKFMAEIIDMTAHIVGQAKNFEHDTIPGDFGVIAVPCPKCGGEVHENYKKFQCVKCDFGFWKILAGRQLEATEAETLISKRDVGPLDGFRSRIGRAFSANVILNKDLVVEFSWGDGAGDDAEPPDFTGQETLGPCPKCKSRVFEMPNSYACEKSFGAAKTCDFRSGRTILKRAIAREEMMKLLETGKSPLLEKFISKKGRPFSAFLVRQPDGKIGFEFEAREPKAGGAKGARAVAGALRILGKHPVDDEEISVFAGRYGPYVKHGKANATIADKEKVDSITLEEAVELLAEKFGAPVKKTAKKTVVKKAAKKVVEDADIVTKTTKATAKKVVVKKPVARKKKAA
jgi:DNA topoisomerase-3